MLVEAMRLASISASAVTARRMRPEALEIAETDETSKNLGLCSSNPLHHVASCCMTLHDVASYCQASLQRLERINWSQCQHVDRIQHDWTYLNLLQVWALGKSTACTRAENVRRKSWPRAAQRKDSASNAQRDASQLAHVTPGDRTLEILAWEKRWPGNAKQKRYVRVGTSLYFCSHATCRFDKHILSFTTGSALLGHEMAGKRACVSLVNGD